MEESKVLVVIPYRGYGSQGNELEYAIAGWRRHFKENFVLVLAGERAPICDKQPDILSVELPRHAPSPENCRKHLDYVPCLKAVHDLFPESKGFVMAADDVYAVNDFTLEDIKVVKYLEPDLDGFKITDRNNWRRDKARTRDKLRSEGYPTINYTTHIPIWFEWDKLEELWKKYNMANVSYVMEDLYHNIYHGDTEPMRLSDSDKYKFGIYHTNYTKDQILSKMKDKIWLQNSEEGWTNDLDSILSGYYGIK